jgi:hypothetical protein
MRIRCIGCEALARLLYHAAARSPHIVDVELLKLGLHNDPPDLRARLQERIDAATADACDHVVLGYALCGQATKGLRARHVPLVIPRAHDCITLFLGSRERYQREFGEHPGTYWYSADYIERGGQDASPTLALGNASDVEAHKTYAEFVEKYGKDNAAYLMEAMGAWQQHYKRAAFIDMGVGDSGAAQARAREEAARRGWAFDRVVGDVLLVRKLIDGDWDDDFLVVNPGDKIVETYDESVMDAAE